MRKTKIAIGEYYHIFNRGNNKQIIFRDYRDWVRFLFLIIYIQSDIRLYNLGRQVTHYVKHSVFNIQNETLTKILKNRRVKLINFSVMPNHFHLTLYEISESGISSYMQRVQNAYTKYYNTKYKTNGHIFQGPFKYVHIKDNQQLLYLSTYIHKNPTELAGWKDKELEYLWSSYQDYVKNNRWGKLLSHEIISEQFLKPTDYKRFVMESIAKKLDTIYLFD